MAIADTALLEYLACPEDKGPLLYFADEDALYNPRLHRRYAIRDGIPVMLIEEARLPAGIGSLDEFKQRYHDQIPQ